MARKGVCVVIVSISSNFRVNLLYRHWSLKPRLRPTKNQFVSIFEAHIIFTMKLMLQTHAPHSQDESFSKKTRNNHSRTAPKTNCQSTSHKHKPLLSNFEKTFSYQKTNYKNSYRKELPSGDQQARYSEVADPRKVFGNRPRGALPKTPLSRSQWLAGIQVLLQGPRSTKEEAQILPFEISVEPEGQKAQ